jgi:2-oxoglutarate ferredoxin oxidoreductase subunit gamma
MHKNILLVGEGGQGIQAIAKIIAEAAFASKKHVSYLPNFGVEQRGGVSLAFIQISDNLISFPKFHKADIVVLLSERGAERVERHFKKETVIIFDNSLISEKKLANYDLEKIAVPAQMYAKEKLIPKAFNIIMLGALMAELETEPIKYKTVKKELEKFFADKIKKEPQLKHFNQRALELGFEVMKSLKKETTWRLKILEK